MKEMERRERKCTTVLVVRNRERDNKKTRKRRERKKWRDKIGMKQSGVRRRNYSFVQWSCK